MTLLDANILLYAYDQGAPQHLVCRQWLEKGFADRDAIAFAWLTIMSFLRLSTGQRVYREPRSWEEAEGIVGTWIEQPAAFLLQPGERHWQIPRSMIRDGQARGLSARARRASCSGALANIASKATKREADASILACKRFFNHNCVNLSFLGSTAELSGWCSGPEF